MNKIIHNTLFLITSIFFILITVIAVIYCCNVLDAPLSLSVFLNTGLFLIIFVLILYITTLMASIYITNKTLKYIEKGLKNIEKDTDLIHALDYDLSPVFTQIIEKNNKIMHFRAYINEQKEQIEMITYNMREGLVVLSKSFKIQLINNSAKLMLSPGYRHREGRNLIEFTREEAILDAVDVAQKTKTYQKILLTTEDKKSFKIYVNPVENKGFIILIVDVTKEMLSTEIKKEFSANVSHELKTPLTIINGFAELISSGIVTDKISIQKHASLIQKEGTRLLLLIEDIMHLSKIESNIKNEIDVDVDIYKVADGVVERLSALAIGKNIAINLSGNSSIIKANTSFIDEMLSNLIENAIKYNKQDGSINVVVENKIITISDTGIGIPKDDIPRIFERFYRVDKSRSKQSGGTGLGLSIIKNIAELYGAKLNISSTPKVGTTISVDFN